MALPEDPTPSDRSAAHAPMLPMNNGNNIGKKAQFASLDQPRSALAATASGLLSGPKGLLIGLGAGILLALGVGRLMGGDSPETATPPAPQTQTASQTVAVAQAQVAPIQTTLMVNGTVSAVDLLEVTPQVSGLQIRQVLVREGDAVTAGQSLASLDDTTLQADIRRQEAQVAVAQAQVKQQRAALAQAQATLSEAQQNLERYRSLAEQGAVSQEELTSRQTQAATAREAVGVAQANVESAAANVRSQQAELDRLRTQLSQTVVRAPAAGVVAERRATVGDVSSSSTPVVTLIQNNQLELEAEVPQAQLDQVVVGAPVTITSSSDSRIRLQAAVRSINPLVEADTRTAIVKIGLPPSDLLRPGMFLQGEVVTGKRQGIVVPTDAVLPQADGLNQVYVLGPNNQVTARSVDLGTRLPPKEGQPARVEVTQGLQPGESVVTSGAGYLQDGDGVQVVDQLPSP